MKKGNLALLFYLFIFSCFGVLGYLYFNADGADNDFVFFSKDANYTKKQLELKVGKQYNVLDDIDGDISVESDNNNVVNVKDNKIIVVGYGSAKVKVYRDSTIVYEYEIISNNNTNNNQNANKPTNNTNNNSNNNQNANKPTNNTNNTNNNQNANKPTNNTSNNSNNNQNANKPTNNTSNNSNNNQNTNKPTNNTSNNSNNNQNANKPTNNTSNNSNNNQNANKPTNNTSNNSNNNQNTNKPTNNTSNNSNNNQNANKPSSSTGIIKKEEPKFEEYYVVLNSSSINIKTGDSYKVVANILPSESSTIKISWSSSNKSIASVDSNGVVKGITAGKVNVTAKLNNGKTAVVIVNVVKKEVPVKKVEIKATTKEIKIGSSTVLTAKITPSDATDSSITWSSKNTKIATVSSGGKVKGIKVGSTTITAKTKNGKSASIKITVKEIPIKSIKLKASKTEIKVGSSLALGAKISPSNATDTTVTWSSSKSGVASVSSNGVVKALKPGTTTISIKTKNGVTSSVTITVKDYAVLKCKNAYYNGTNQVIATCSGGTINNATAKNAGTYVVSCTPDEYHYKVSNIKCNINKTNIKNSTNTSIDNKKYVASEIKPKPYVTYNNIRLNEGTDYTLEYSNNTNSGTASIKLKGKGNFNGEKNVTFKILNNCYDITKKISIKEGNPTVSSCLTDFTFYAKDVITKKFKRYAYQNLAVTDNYYYLSGVAKNSYPKDVYDSADSATKALYAKNMSSANIRRISKKDAQDNKLGFLNYSGHNGFFDAYTQGTTDYLLMEHATKVYFDPDQVYRTAFKGFGLGTFKQSNDYNDNEIIPSKSYFLNDYTDKIETVKYSAYSSKSSYYNKIKSIGNNNSFGTYSFAVDKDKNVFVLMSGNSVFLYKYDEYIKGNKVRHNSYKNIFTINGPGNGVGSIQGIELGGGYLYLVYGSNWEFSDSRSNTVIRRISLADGKEKSRIVFNLGNYFKTKINKNGVRATSYETEGISYYKGSLYVGTQYFINGGVYVEIIKVDI